MARAGISGAKLHELRMEARMELKDLAERAEVSVHTLSDVEAGRRLHVLDRTLFDLARALGVKPSDLEIKVNV